MSNSPPSNEGIAAMCELSKIESLLLEHLDERWLRRNMVHYELVTYVHHAMVLSWANRPEGAATFARRIRRWLNDNAEVDLGNYGDVVRDYLATLEQDVGRSSSK